MVRVSVMIGVFGVAVALTMRLLVVTFDTSKSEIYWCLLVFAQLLVSPASLPLSALPVQLATYSIMKIKCVTLLAHKAHILIPRSILSETLLQEELILKYSSHIVWHVPHYQFLAWNVTTLPPALAASQLEEINRISSTEHASTLVS